MSNTVDQRVVEMQFNNKSFEKNVSGTMSTLDKLKTSLGFKGVSSGFDSISSAAGKVDMGGLAGGVEQVRLKFDALQIFAITALTRIANKVIDTGKQLVKSFTIDPLKDGMKEYETKLNSIQTIMSNTASKGTTMKDVTGVIAELNTYADKTIYNFAEMTRNIGTFTAAGVGLETAATAIKGIANLAAASGSNSQQASTAMYQLSQALSTGTVKLMDWNSVVNAGMGGEKFQEALKVTAKQHGVAIDDIIASNGSFRDSLQEGWLSADILNETLNNFTVDGAAAYTKAQMQAGLMTQEQADAMNKEAQAMEDAATKVKTFTQLMDTLKEAAGSGWATTWEILIGNFNEAKEMFTGISDTLGGMIGKSADARNKLLSIWKAMGGRDDIINTFKAAFEGLMIVVNALKSAFKEVFPPITVVQLKILSTKLSVLSSKFKMSEENAAKLKTVFKGVFSILHIVTTAFSSLFKVISPGTSIIGMLAQAILNVAAYIANWAIKLDEAFTGMGVVGYAAEGMSTSIVDAFKKASEFIQNSGIYGALDKLGGYFATIGDFISTKWGELWAFITSKTSEIDFSKILKGGIVAFIIAKIALVVKAIGGLTDTTKSFTGILDAIKDIGAGAAEVLDGVKDSLSAFVGGIKAKTLLTIALAVGILAVSLFVLSTIDGPGLARSLGALTILLVELVGALALLAKMGPLEKGMTKTVAMMIGMSVAILILAGAMKMLSTLNWGEIARGLVAIGALMGMLVGVTKILAANKKTMIKGAATLIIFAIAIKIMTSALMDLGTLSFEQIGNGLFGLLGIMAGLALFINNTSMDKSMTKSAIALLAMAVAIKIISDAVIQLATLSLDQLITGLGGLAGMMLILAGAIKLMPSESLVATGIGLTIAAVGVKILAGAVLMLGQMGIQQVGIALVALAGSLGILAAGLYCMTGTLAGSAALLVAAIALGILTPTLILLSGVPFDKMMNGLIIVATALIGFGAAAGLLTPVLPAMAILAGILVLLGVAAASLGAGLFLAGIGLTSIAMAISMLSGVSAAAAISVTNALTTILSGLVTLIPNVISAFATGLLNLVVILGNGAGQIATAVVQIVAAILTALVTVIPQAVQVFFQLVVALVNALAEYVPIIAEGFFQMILGILQVLADNIPPIIQAGVNIIVALIEGIASAVPQLVDAGFKAIITFINGLADSIRENTPLMIDAVNNLFDAVVEAGKAVLLNSIGGFLSAGSSIMNSGFVQGIRGAIGSVIGAAGSVIQGAKNAFSGAVGDFMSIGSNIISGLASGITNGVHWVVSAAREAASSAYNAAKDFLNINSPSKKFRSLGDSSDEGLASGIIRSIGMVTKASKKVAEHALDTMSNTLGNLSSMMLSDIEADPVIRPIVDLSEIQNGADQINSMMGNRTMNLASSANINQAKRQSTTDIVESAVKSTINSLMGHINDDKQATNVVIEVPLYMDGREVAKATAPYSLTEINKINTLKDRLGGTV